MKKKMKAEFVNPFIVESHRVLRKMAYIEARTGKMFARDIPFTGGDVTVIVGVTGDIEGEVLYSMDVETAKKIASAMMMGMPVLELDEMSRSALSELGNMITGKASISLEENGFYCNVTPPTLISGSNISISTIAIKALAVVLDTDLGSIEINVALKQRSA